MYENPRTVALCPRAHRNRINCIDRHRVHRCTNAADCDAGWEFAADKFGDGKFPIFVSRSGLTGPPRPLRRFELMATVSSAAAAAEMNPAAEQMARAKYPKAFVVRGVIFFANAVRRALKMCSLAISRPKCSGPRPAKGAYAKNTGKWASEREEKKIIH